MTDYVNYLRSLVPDSSESSSTGSSSQSQKRRLDSQATTNIPSKRLRSTGPDIVNTELSGGDDIENLTTNQSATTPSQPFQQGTTIYSDTNVEVHIQAVDHQRHTRFRAEDHLFQVTIHPNRRRAPMLLSLETALKEALMSILLQLQNNYPSTSHHQVYITIIENKIKHGLNTGNYDLSAPPTHVVNRALTILHSYLKSNQTMKLSDSFKIQIKVLSHRHTQHLVSNKPRFQKKIFRDYKRIRN